MGPSPWACKISEPWYLRLPANSTAAAHSSPKRVCTTAGYWLCCKASRSEEHTSELQSRGHLVCRLLLEKKNTNAVTGSSSPQETQCAQSVHKTMSEEKIATRRAA